jgi:hypothetical protein
VTRLQQGVRQGNARPEDTAGIVVTRQWDGTERRIREPADELDCPDVQETVARYDRQGHR